MRIIGVMFATEASTVLSVMAILLGALGTTGAGGLAVMWRRLAMERQVSVEDAATEKLRAMFPGGFSEAIEYWQKEAREQREEIDKLRDKADEDHTQMLQQEREISLLNTKIVEQEREIAQLRWELNRAEQRIESLEDGRGTSYD